jgi:anaerobic selenocysteine-containing dehydrogenase
MVGFERLARSVEAWTPERQERVTGVPAAALRDLVRAHSEASRSGRGAALSMATGVNQGRSGSPCFWLLESINAISGNLDRKGGTLLGSGLIDMGDALKELALSYDREDGLPTVSGLQPSGMLADDILGDPNVEDDPRRIRAMIVEASNPLLACSNPDGRLDERSRAELLVTSISSATGRHLAHYVLRRHLDGARDPVRAAKRRLRDALHHLCRPVLRRPRRATQW